MKMKFKDTLIKRNKKYDYKIYEHETYSIMSGYEYSYYITNYNENKTIASGLINWNMVQNELQKIENKDVKIKK